MKMLYEKIKPMRLYTMQEFTPPKGERSGYGEMMLIASQSQQETLSLLNSDFIDYRKGFYKHYYIESVYKERIGKKKVVENNKKMVKEVYDQGMSEVNLKLVPYGSRKSYFNKGVNIITDLGYWHELFFKYASVLPPKTKCKSYLSFIATKLSDSFFEDYNKILYIDISKWIGNSLNRIKLTPKTLTNPLFIILYSIIHMPEELVSLGNIDIVLVDSFNNKVMKIPSSEFTPKNFGKLRAKITQIIKLDMEEDFPIQEDPEESVVNIPKTPTTIKSTTQMKPASRIVDRVISTPNSIVKPVVNPDKSVNVIVDKIIPQSKEEELAVKKQRILRTVKKNFIGEVEDISDIINDEDISEDVALDRIDDDIEFDVTVNDFLDKNQDIIEDMDDAEAIKNIEDFIKKKNYIAKIVPEKTEKEKEKIAILSKTQETVIGLPSFTNLKSKTIEEDDFSEFIDTINPNIVKSKFVNFDKAYNSKKLGQDIDDSVGILADAEYPIFIVGKDSYDSSDQLNMKKTLVYQLEDYRGKSMTLKFDVPIVVEDKFLYLNGSKKIIQKQLILKPLVKTSPDTVQIVAAYNKIQISRKGDNDLVSSALKKYLLSKSELYMVRYGNSIVKNREYRTTLEFDTLAKTIYEFTIADNRFILDLSDLFSILDTQKINYSKVNQDTHLIVGYNTKTKAVLSIERNEDLSDYIMDFLSEDIKNTIASTKVGKRLMFAQCTIMNKKIPLILFMLFCDGLTKVMEKAKIEYKFITPEEFKSIDTFEWGYNVLEDCILIWKRYPLQNSLLMNGLQNLPLELYSRDVLDSKDTYIFILSQFYAFANMSFNLDQYKDFMIDSITKEVLMDFDLPTDLVSLMAYAATLLIDNDFIPENDLRNIRLRSNEIIAFHVYGAITAAYRGYRRTQHKKNPTKITINPDFVMKQLKTSKLVEEHSVLNPVLELEKSRSVTYKGERGINKDRAMTLSKRGYDESMLGVLGISTSPDANVGIVRQLTLEPAVTSTRGYIQTHNLKNVNELNSANLLTPAELLTPLGVQHDDPTRTSMAYKQSKYMLMVEDSEPVMIGNKVESIIPYHMSDEFTIVAEKNGEVIDRVNDVIVIKYIDGSYKSIDVSESVKKNSSSGFWIITQLETHLEVGQKVKKGEILAFNSRAFSRNTTSNDVSMNLGSLVKIAVVPSWDIFEDSKPVTKMMSEKLATTMVAESRISLDKGTNVDFMVNIGDEVNTGDTLIKFDSTPDDPFAAAFLDSIRKDLQEDIISDNITTISAKYAGIVTDIKIHATVDVNNLHPTLQKITKDYYKRLNSKISVLKKYSNPGDTDYYKSGTLITEAPEKIDPNMQGKIKGERVDEGILVSIYIKYRDVMGKGDKSCSEFALKGIVSHVIDENLEPYSEYRPDEEISTFISPLAISARKTPSLFIAMFGNKLLIEAKNQLRDIYFEK